MRANSVVDWDFEVPLLNEHGNFAIQQGTAQALTFTIYGFKKAR